MMRVLLVCWAAAAFVGCTPRGESDFRIMLNYELGMHCTGFDFEYCCILPPYNSVQAQVVKVGDGTRLPRLLEACDPSDPTVLLDTDTGRRYRLKYDIVDNTFSEGGKLNYWKAPFDMNRNGNANDPGESVANAYFSHLYIYRDMAGGNPENTSDDGRKLFVGGPGLQVPLDAGPTGQKLAGFLRCSGATGTVVFTKSPALDNTPIVLTNPGIWEAVGLPVTPFLDSEVAGRDLKKVTEESVQPYQAARVVLVDAASGAPVRDSRGAPVEFRGTTPIDVPNCANCHATDNVNVLHPDVAVRVKAELEYWRGAGASEWYARQKATSIGILSIHDKKHATRFTEKYDPAATSNRLGRGAVICQKCHADNVIGVLGAGTVTHRADGTIVVEDRARVDGAAAKGTAVDVLNGQQSNVRSDGAVVPALSEALHNVHVVKRPMPDGQGRTGSCQGCHPAHRFDRNLLGYPITPEGQNAYSGAPGAAGNDNRDAPGGCFVRRDVHSNPNKDKDGAGTPEHLNPIGQWLKDNVSRKDGTMKGLWCTNCHSSISKELYTRDRLAPGRAFAPKPEETLRDDTLEEIADALELTRKELLAKLDPKVVPNAMKHDEGESVAPWLSKSDGRETAAIGVVAGDGVKPIVTKDGDGDASVKLIDPNPDNVAAHANEKGVAVAYDAATSGRDYWLSPGEPHCADCHAPPFVEAQGGLAFPINQPGKYSLMRYSKGHAGLACQACHESAHGLYPVTPDVDRTTYAQAAQLNADGSHGPLKCATCHKEVNPQGVPRIAAKIVYDGKNITADFDRAVMWIHATAPDLGGRNPGIAKTGY